jgi:hypothetical protein
MIAVSNPYQTAMTRLSLLAAALATAVACGSSPTSPSSVGGGATINGTVVSAPFPSNVTVVRSALSSGVDGSGGFQLQGVPTGDVQLAFGGTGSTVTVANVADGEVIDLEVAIVSGVAQVRRERRGNQGKVVICHRDDRGYHTIEVSVNAESAHRGHGDATPGEQVPDDPSQVFDAVCRRISPLVIQKFTNGQDANVAPGPTIPVGSPVNWTYVVTNHSRLVFTSLTVVDDRGVAVACPNLLPQPGASITCNGSGTSVAGQYRNVGTVTVTANGRSFTASDPSHYFGGPTPP